MVCLQAKSPSRWIVAKLQTSQYNFTFTIETFITEGLIDKGTKNTDTKQLRIYTYAKLKPMLPILSDNCHQKSKDSDACIETPTNVPV